MTEQDILFPFEFFIAGTPVSLQAKGRGSLERWKSDVGKAARLRLQETYELGILDERPLAVTIYYFPTAKMTGDVDNIIKPILDAMKSIAYSDDRLVDRVVVQKFEPDVDSEFVAPSLQLAAALDTARPIVYVRVDDDQHWRRI